MAINIMFDIPPGAPLDQGQTFFFVLRQASHPREEGTPTIIKADAALEGV